MSRSRVEKKINLVKYAKVLTETIAIGVAFVARDSAISNVRVDTGKLKRSIEVEFSGSNITVVAEAPHATAQEYGRPDLKNYGFTPYMRPAAMEATSAGKLSTIVAGANMVALKAAKI